MNVEMLFQAMSLASKMEHKEPITAQAFIGIAKELDTQIKILEYQLDKLKHVLDSLKDYPIKELVDAKTNSNLE